MNSAAVSPPRNRMKRAPSPLTLFFSEGAAVFLHHVDVVDTPFRREAERVIAAVVNEGFPEGDDDRFGVPPWPVRST